MEKDFDRISISRLVVKLGIPALFAQFFNILYSIVDRAFVGHIPSGGELALASVGVCAPILTAITAFSSLIGIGGASVMSISVGRKAYKDAKKAVSNSLLLLLAVSIVLTASAYAAARPLLYGLGCSDAMYPYAEGYFRIYVTGTIFVLCGTGMNQFILAQGNARRGMLAVMLGAVVNTVLDPILITVLHMGIKGAAAATVIAQFCVFLYVLFFFFTDRALFKIQPAAPDFDIVQKILRIGSLPFLIILFDNLLVIALNFTLRKYGSGSLGDQYISCAAVVQSFMLLAFYPAQGITAGCGTLYSYHYGAGHYQKVMQVFRYVFCLCAGYTLILCVAAQVFPGFFARIFVQEEETIALSASCIRKYTSGLLGVAVQYAIVDGLTAMGQIRFALPISFFRKILYVVCVFMLPIYLPLENIFYVEAISDLIGASVTLSVFLLRIAPGLREKMSAPGNAES